MYSKKWVCLILAVVLSVSVMPMAFAEGFVGENEELEVNEGRIEENWGTVKINMASGLTPESEGEGIVTNYWRVNENRGAVSVNYGEMVDASTDLYSAAEIYTNGGTVFTNLGVIYTNSAAVEFNAFLVMNNTEGAVVTDNLGDLAEVNMNRGRVINNGNDAVIDVNDYTGTVENNSAFVGVNFGTVYNQEGGRIDYNFGRLIQNGETYYGIGFREDETVTLFDPLEQKVNAGFRVGESVILPGKDFYTKPGSALTGWLSSADGKIYKAGETYQMPASPAMFTAQWQNNASSM